MKPPAKDPKAPRISFQIRKGDYWLQGTHLNTSGGWGPQSCANRYTTEAEATKIAKLFPHSEVVRIEEA